MSGREDYEPAVGVEIHAQLLTSTKLFCGCPARFGDPPNTNVCPVCLGLPGALPVLNRRAVELALAVALAVECRVNQESVFARKNYFYPDLPKGYQISQYDKPLASRGKLVVPLHGAETAVGITRVHLEEDAGKLLHERFPDSRTTTGVDFNRSGVPLIEVVSDPELRDGMAAAAFGRSLKSVLEYTGASDADMEKGNLRCDANVSVSRRGDPTLGVRVELKNLNSFRFLARAIDFEIDRQVEIIEKGDKVSRETRHYDPSSGRTQPLRGKEQTEDYRYFPDPDLPPLRIVREWTDRVRSSLPELPAAKRARFVDQYGIPASDADILTRQRPLADYFEATASASGSPRAASNWILSELLRKVRATGEAVPGTALPPRALAELIRLVDQKIISGKTAKEVFETIYLSGESPLTIVEKEGLGQITDHAVIESVVRKVVSENPRQVERYRKGRTQILRWLMGRVMKETRGRADPHLAEELLEKTLSAIDGSDDLGDGHGSSRP